MDLHRWAWERGHSSQRQEYQKHGGGLGNADRVPMSLGWWSHSGEKIRKEKQIAGRQLWVLNSDYKAGLESHQQNPMPNQNKPVRRRLPLEQGREERDRSSSVPGKSDHGPSIKREVSCSWDVDLRAKVGARTPRSPVKSNTQGHREGWE